MSNFYYITYSTNKVFMLPCSKTNFKEKQLHIHLPTIVEHYNETGYLVLCTWMSG